MRVQLVRPDPAIPLEGRAWLIGRTGRGGAATYSVPERAAGRGDAVTADLVLTTPKGTKLPKPPALPGGKGPDIASRMASNGTAMGVVSDVGAGGFTVTSSSGQHIRVTASNSTKVIKQEESRLERLAMGKYTVVVGTLDGSGTLRVTMVQQDTLTSGPKQVRPDVPEPGEGFGSGGPNGLPSVPKPPGSLDVKPPNNLFSGLGCDSEAIAGSALNGTAL